MTALAALLLASAAQTTVEVPFKMTEHAMIVDCVVNGKPLSFMFDTGFSGAFVVDNTVNLGKSTGAITLRDFVREFQAETVPVKSIKLGSKTIEPRDMTAVMQPADYSFSYQTHVDGIMGFDVVRNQVMELNFEKQKMIFHPNTVDITKRTPDNKKTFLAKMLPKGMGSMEMEVKIDGGSERLVLALDTGNAFFATTHRDVLERVGVWKSDRKPIHMKQAFVASGAVDSWYLTVPKSSVFGVPVEQSTWSIIDLPSSSAQGDGTVGFGFLKNFNIIIDYERRRVWLENFTGRTNNDPEGDCGVTAAYHPGAKRTVIVRVQPDSPAAKAGLKAGDSLLAINGKEILGAIGFGELSEMLEGPVGSKVNLTISTGGELKRIELERISLVNLL